MKNRDTPVTACIRKMTNKELVNGTLIKLGYGPKVASRSLASDGNDALLQAVRSGDGGN